MKKDRGPQVAMDAKICVIINLMVLLERMRECPDVYLWFPEQRRLLSDWLISSVFSLVNLLKVIPRAGKNAKVRCTFGGVG